MVDGASSCGGGVPGSTVDGSSAAGEGWLGSATVARGSVARAGTFSTLPGRMERTSVMPFACCSSATLMPCSRAMA